MRLMLLVLAIVGAVFAAGFWLLPLLLVHAPAVVGALGVLLLVCALLVPGKPKCEGFHCAGCSHH